jgi:WbqC-like protein
VIVTVHQPHFMPWLGYLHRMTKADLFIVLDHVQFERRNYQNRTMVLVNGEPRWLTVPVVQRSQKERIVEKEIDNGLAGTPRWWSACHYQTLRHAYRDAPCWGEYEPELRRIFGRSWGRLVELNDAVLGFLREAFGIGTKIVRSSELKARGAKSELILNLCREVGADELLVGLGGSRDYLDKAAFAQHGIGLAYQEFEHPVYPQCGAGPFAKGLSSIDLLLNCGADSRRLLLEGGAALPVAAPAAEGARAAA